MLVCALLSVLAGITLLLIAYIYGPLAQIGWDLKPIPRARDTRDKIEWKSGWAGHQQKY